MMTVDFTPIFLSLLPLFLATGTLLGLALQNAETTSTATTPNIRWSQLLYRPGILKNSLRIAMSSTKFWTKSCKHQISTMPWCTSFFVFLAGSFQTFKNSNRKSSWLFLLVLMSMPQVHQLSLLPIPLRPTLLYETRICFFSN